MRSMGPLWALVLTLDRNLLFLILMVNLLFALGITRIAFHDRRPLETLLICTGVFALVTVVSMASLYLFARTPVHELQFFALD